MGYVRMPPPQHVHCPLCGREAYRQDESDRWTCCGCGAMGWYKSDGTKFRVQDTGAMIWRDGAGKLVEGEAKG